MSINSINPTVQLPNNKPAVALPQKPVENNNTNRKDKISKFIIPAAVAAGITAVAIGGILAHKGISPSKLLKESKILQGKAQEIITDSQSVEKNVNDVFKEVQGIIREGIQNGFIETKNGNITRKFIMSESGIPQILEERNGAGELLRKTKILQMQENDITSSIPKSIEEFIEKGKSNIFEFDFIKGKYDLNFGVIKSKNGTIKEIGRSYTFDYDWDKGRYLLSKCMEGHKFNQKSGRETIDTVFDFNKGTLQKISTSYNGINKDNFIYQNSFNYDKNGNLLNVLENTTSDKDFSKMFTLDSNGELKLVENLNRSFILD